MRRRIVKFVALTFLLILLLTSIGYSAEEPDPSGATRTSFVTEVIDGDTIELAGGEHVRYIGLDTPETEGPNKIKEHFGARAAEFNRKLVGGKKVKLEFDVEKRDKYGRLLAYVFVKREESWIPVNAELLKKGYARLFTKPPNNKYADHFLRLERKARKNCRGLWKTYCDGLKVFSAEGIEKEMSKHLGEVVTVEYRITGTYNSGKVVFLNSSNNYEEDFTAVIFTNNLERFLDSGVEPQDLQERTVKVTGELQKYDGPEIVLYRPYQLEVLN